MTHAMLLLIIGIASLGLGVILLGVSRGPQDRRDLLARVVTSPASQVPYLLPGAPVEVTGILRCDAPLTGEISRHPCAYYDARVTREYDRRRTDADGRTYLEHHTEEVSANRQSTPFYVEDTSGRVLVRPDGAEIDAQQVVDRFEPGAAGGPDFGKAGFAVYGVAVSDETTVGYKYVERVLPVDAQVFVLGTVQQNGEIGRPPTSSPSDRFIVSYRSAETLELQLSRNAHWFSYASMAFVVAGVALVVVGLVSLRV
ncbi:MAG TPA: E3 ubiquitin ligase family protein [Thermomicrobiaceae bacterium]|nr:E3 ubiquitin ligase family protein [Thermomicrobiaceae bacterium]